MKVAIIDYGMGNLNSVAKAFEALNAETQVTNRAADLEAADRIVLPGVGAFGEGMNRLEKLRLIEPLKREVKEKKKPFLGICLGMQLLAQESFEHGRHAGLGWVRGAVKPFDNDGELKSIHIGWSDVIPSKDSGLFQGLGMSPNFYFVHGFHLDSTDPASAYATSAYGKRFVSAVKQDNIVGVQFHPEKSQETGLAFLNNFLKWEGLNKKPKEAVAEKVSQNQPKQRLIPTLLLKDGRLVKTVQFQIPKQGLRTHVGDPVKAPMVYDAQLADELVLLDIHATCEGRTVANLCRAIQAISGRIFMPLTAGGGVRSTEDVRSLLKAGADKVVINSAAVSNPKLISEAAMLFGNQCVVIAIDVRRRSDGSYEVVTESATKATGMDVVAWAKQAEKFWAGELLLTSIDRDGTMQGYDKELIEQVSQAVNIPVIASGGAGSLEDLLEGLQAGASAVAAASLFHFRDISPIKAKAFLQRSGLAVRQ